MRRYPAPTIYPPRGSLPVMLSVPHAGREYDESILANARQGVSSLEPLEDPLVDRLCWRAIGSGIGAVVQNVPRAAIDCNRGEDEVDPAAIEGISPAPVGERARSGLGIVPSRTHRHGALWRQPVDRAEFRRRLDQVHAPYHQALANALDHLRTQYGEAVLLDCHSMPVRRGTRADLVIGDRHGSTAASWLTAETARLARQAGFRVALNAPYAGGAIVARHGQPALGIHALQLEFCRSSYLQADGRTAGPGFDRVARLIHALAEGLGEALASRNLGIAAE